MSGERRACVQGEHMPRSDPRYRPGGTVAWWEHEEAWDEYARQGHGSQSAERIHERAGYGYWEITKLLGHEPTTWVSNQPPASAAGTDETGGNR